MGPERHRHGSVPRVEYVLYRTPSQYWTCGHECEIPYRVKRRIVTTVTLDEDIADRIAAVREAGLALNVSKAARAGILAELEGLEAAVAILKKRKR